MLKRRSSEILRTTSHTCLSHSASACGNSSSGSGSSDDSQTSLGNKEIEIPYIASDNSTPRSLVIAEVLKKAGYDVTTTPVTANWPIIRCCIRNSDSFHASGIFPTTDKVTTISSKVN